MDEAIFPQPWEGTQKILHKQIVDFNIVYYHSKILLMFAD